MEEEAAQTVHYQHVFPSVMAAAVEMEAAAVEMAAVAVEMAAVAVEMASLAVEMASLAVEMACETSPSVLHFLFSLWCFQ